MAAEERGLKPFYTVLGAVVVIGVIALGYLMTRPTSVEIPADVLVEVQDTAGFRGYVLGSAEAPIEVIEYADYQCPFCQQFSTVQFPTIKSRLIETGKVRWRYRDFPLDQAHPHARVAAHAAACANDQGRYWEMHDAIFNSFAEWNTARNAAPIFQGLAERLGLDMAAYEGCMADARYAGRIQAAKQEGVRVGVGSTPSFVLNGRLYTGGAMTYDMLKALSDSIEAAATE